MSESQEGLGALLLFLNQHRDSIASNWATAASDRLDSPYRLRSREQLQEWATGHVDAVCAALAADSFAGLEPYIVTLSADRLSLGFDIGEVVQGFLLWRECVLSSLSDYLQTDTADVALAREKLESGIRYLIARFAHVYAATVRQREEQLAVIQERQRIARELHDSVTQGLYSTQLYAEAAERLLRAGDCAHAISHVASMKDIARESLRDMRLLIFQLRPSVLETQGLVAALRARLIAVEERAGVDVSLTADDGLIIPAAVAEELYRIAQEALNNSIKHSHARHIGVRIRRELEGLTLEIWDDGTGFSPAAGNGGGLGLDSMAARARRVGAEFSIDSNISTGTSITVRVPVNSLK